MITKFKYRIVMDYDGSFVPQKVREDCMLTNLACRNTIGWELFKDIKGNVIWFEFFEDAESFLKYPYNTNEAEVVWEGE